MSSSHCPPPPEHSYHDLRDLNGLSPNLWCLRRIRYQGNGSCKPQTTLLTAWHSLNISHKFILGWQTIFIWSLHVLLAAASLFLLLLSPLTWLVICLNSCLSGSLRHFRELWSWRWTSLASGPASELSTPCGARGPWRGNLSSYRPPSHVPTPCCSRAEARLLLNGEKRELSCRNRVITVHGVTFSN